MPKCKVNPLKLNEKKFLAELHKKEGRYVKRYFFSNGLGASVICHNNSYGGDAGYFEVAIMQYELGTDPEETSQVVCEHPIHKRHGAVDVFGWLDFHEVASILKEIRNYDTGEYYCNGQ